MMDDDIFDISDGGSSDFVPEPAPVLIDSMITPEYRLANHIIIQKTKAKAAPKKAATAPKATTKKMTQTTLKPKANKKMAKADSEDEVSDAHMSDDDNSLLSHTPPKAKKAAAPKRAGSKPLGDVENESFVGDGASEAPGKNDNASDKYQKVSRSIEQTCSRRFGLTQLSAAYTTRTHYQTSRYLHWLRRSYHSADVGLQLRVRIDGVPSGHFRPWSLQNF